MYFIVFIYWVIVVYILLIILTFLDSAKEDWIKAFKLIRAFGLFGFIGMLIESSVAYVTSFIVSKYSTSGGMTNWLAIRMMFDKIPFLIGSGILLNNFAEIRDNVKKTTMETYFDAGHLSHYVTQKTEIILNSLQLGNVLNTVT